MKVFKYLTAAVVLAGSGAMAGSALADEHATGLVQRIYPHGNNIISFKVHGDCKAVSYWHFSMDAPVGKAWYAMLLAAAHNKTPIRYAYVGPCSPNTNQQINYLYQDF